MKIFSWVVLVLVAEGEPQGTGRVPLDKEKGFVKGEDILSGAEHRLFSTSERVWDRNSGISPLNHVSGGSLHQTIDTT